MSCPETRSVFSIRVPKTRRERLQRRQTQRLEECEDVLMSSGKTAMSSHEVIGVSHPNTLLSHPKTLVSTHKTSTSLLRQCPKTLVSSHKTSTCLPTRHRRVFPQDIEVNYGVNAQRHWCLPSRHLCLPSRHWRLIFGTVL